MKSVSGQSFFGTMILLLILLVSGCPEAISKPLNLETGFVNPPDSVNPWVYWYWYSDNISRSGIDKDLKAMADVGIGTALIGNVSDGGEIGSVKVLSDEWWGMIQHAIREADKYGIDIGLFNCPGWSQSGGPWIQAEQTMRYLVINETRLLGPQRIRTKLSSPNPPFQDVSVLAVPAPKSDDVYLHNKMVDLDSKPVTENLQFLFDGEFTTTWNFPEASLRDNRFMLDIKLKMPLSVRSLSIYPAPAPFSVQCDLQAEVKDGTFETIKSFEMQRPPSRFDIGPMFDAPTTVSFAKVESDHFRLLFHDFAPHEFIGKITKEPGIAEIKLSSAARLERYIEKQLGKMFWLPLPMWDDYLWEESQKPESRDYVIPVDSIQNISQYLSASDILEWDVPPGDWIIQRVSMIPTGAKNSPVLPEARGYEVDKMNRKLAEYHFESYIGKLLRDMPIADRKALKYVVIDSYEKGSQNWSDGMRNEFMQRYSYDPFKWLPVLSGRIVESADQSDRFLWDLRRMVADKVAQDYIAGLRETAHKYGLKLWMENYGHWGFPGEFLQYGGQSDIVSGEFWAAGNLGSIELKAASSAAHIYGQTMTCSESFTSGPPQFSYYPWAFKKRGDWSFTEGINQTLLHVYIHQAYDDRLPGVNAWFGSAFNRHNTWFYCMGSWLNYLRRCNYMLQQGKYVADVAYFIGEDTPKMTGIQQPKLPNGYLFDYINADVIMNRLSMHDKRFVLPDGMSYKLLVLPPLKTIRPEVLKKIGQLVQQGGVIYGPRPVRSPSMHNYPDCDIAVRNMAAMLWQDVDGKICTHTRYGEGHVYWGQDLKAVLTELATPPDVDSVNSESVAWIHRRLAGQDVYFLANQSENNIEIAPLFRVSDKKPELWDAVSGEITKTALYEKVRDGVKVTIVLGPLESVFVVFRNEPAPSMPVQKVVRQGEQDDLKSVYFVKDGIQARIKKNGMYTVYYSADKYKNIVVDDIPDTIQVNGPWKVRFQANRDVPEVISFPSLQSWTDSDHPGIKYYSGSAVYSNSVIIPESFIRDDYRVLINLGKVGVIAGLSVNGKDFGDFWRHPFEADITDAIKLGRNELEIKATNIWRNRLIGDARYPDGFPTSKAGQKPFKTSLVSDVHLTGDEQLTPSGLMGPVTINAVKVVSLDGN